MNQIGTMSETMESIFLGKKNKQKELEDLKKAFWYLQHHITKLEKNEME